jgi:RNA polymerase sigma factor (sigma-70 family)
MPDATPSSSDHHADGVFATTHWSVVLAAQREDSTRARDALASLCQTYWYPLYAYVRRKGNSPHDAQDLTQEFFARLLEKHWLADVKRERGRFRSFLLAAMKHFLANEWDKAQAQKRGGGERFIALDAASAETRYALEPVDNVTAEKVFERRWAMTLLDRVLQRLRRGHETAGKTAQFDTLKEALTGDRSALPYVQLGDRLGLSEGAVKVAVHRLRQRYRELLREEIAGTVAKEDDVEEELRHLFAILRG